MWKTIKCVLFHWFCHELVYVSGVRFDVYEEYKCRKCGRITVNIQNV